MPRTSLIAESPDRLDPWGFGTTAADEPTAVLNLAGLGDDDLDDTYDSRPAGDDDADDAVAELVARLVDGPRSGAAARAPWPAAVPPKTAPLTFVPPVAATPVPPASPVPSAAADTDASGASNAATAHTPLPARGTARSVPRAAAVILSIFALVVFGEIFYIGLSLGESVGVSTVPNGELVLSSHPAGARVSIDGRDQGVTPLVASLPVGAHQVHIAGADGAEQTLTADVSATARWARHVVLTPASAAAAALRIDTAAPGAAVWLDGQPVGTTPITLPGLAAGDHGVRVQFAKGGTVDRRVVLAGGETVSLVVDAPAAKAAIPAGPASGWVRVESSFDVQVLEAGQVVGSSASDRILVTAGGHVFELVNASLGFRTTVKVAVGAGRTEALVVDTPRTSVQVNAQPWAEVVVDGRVLGETPLANVMLPIGTHSFVFRHPELGERTQPVTVRLTGPNRVTANLRGEQ